MITDYTDVELDPSSSVKVYIRLRPPEGGVPTASDQIERDDSQDGKITIHSPTQGHHKFLFHKVFGPDSSQREVFQEVAVPAIDHCFDGYNSCIFAYGQTGSGKTYTMFGAGGDAAPGVIPRTVETVFSRLAPRKQFKDVAVVVSFLEIYLDRVRDLGRVYQETIDAAKKEAGEQEQGAGQEDQEWFMRGFPRWAGFGGRPDEVSREYEDQSLEIHESSNGQVFVRGLSHIPLEEPEEAMRVVRSGFSLRATHETGMNRVSSRSHTVLTIHVIQRDKASGEQVHGRINLVDLAGSERLSRSHSEGIRMAEARNINSSLTALGKVIMKLDQISQSANKGAEMVEAGSGTESTASKHVPYRDSKLTRILQNSLAGNSFTSLLATVHPRREDIEESLMTLQFANRCRNVTSKPQVNYTLEDAEDKDRRIRVLMIENMILRQQLAGDLLLDGRFQAADGTVLGMSPDQVVRTDFARRMIAHATAPAGALSEVTTNAAAMAAMIDLHPSRAKGGLQDPEADARMENASIVLSDTAMSKRMDWPSPQWEDVSVIPKGSDNPLAMLAGLDLDRVTKAVPGSTSSGTAAMAGTSEGKAQDGGGAAAKKESQGMMPRLLVPDDDDDDEVSRPRGTGLERSGAQRRPSLRGIPEGLHTPRRGIPQSARSIGTRHSDIQWDEDEGRSSSGGAAASQKLRPLKRGGGTGGGRASVPGSRQSGAASIASSATKLSQRFGTLHDTRKPVGNDEILELENKVDELKQQLMIERGRHKDELASMRTAYHEQRDRAQRAKAAAEEARRQARDSLETTAVSHEQQLHSILDHNRELMESEHSLLTSLPKSLRATTEARQEISAVEERVRREESAKRRRDVKNAVQGVEAEVESERQKRQQAEEQHRASMRRMKRKFIRWYEMTQRKMGEMEDELLSLWTYAHGLSELLRQVEAGDFPIEHSTSGHKAFHIPRRHLPLNPLGGTEEGGMPHLRTLLSSDIGMGGRSQLLGASLNRAMSRPGSRASSARRSTGIASGKRPSSRQSTDANAAKLPRTALDAAKWQQELRAVGGRKQRPVSAGSVPDLDDTSSSGAEAGHEDEAEAEAPVRVRSARGDASSGVQRTGSSPPPLLPRARASSQDNVKGEVDAPSSALEERLEVMERELNRRATRGEVDMETDVRGMDASTLRAHVQALRTYIQQGLRTQTEDQILNDLAELPTVEYVRQLETEQEVAQKRLQEERERANQLRLMVRTLQQSRHSRRLEEQGSPMRRKGRRPMSARPDHSGSGGNVLRSSENSASSPALTKGAVARQRLDDSLARTLVHTDRLRVGRGTPFQRNAGAGLVAPTAGMGARLR